uniref:DUF4939 domain-containing protein n=1 Tax=Hippocampus comes TaxID=109280 RepID=A0A3Q2YQN1_HIPCM
MDPADIEKVLSALSSLEQFTSQESQAITELRGAVSMLAHRFEDFEPRLVLLEGRRASSTEVPVHSPTFRREPTLPHPSRYGGEHGQCGHFLHQCSLIFDQQPSVYVNDDAKVAYIMSLLTGQAASWAIAVSEAQPNLRSSYPGFVAAFRRVSTIPFGEERTEVDRGRALAVLSCSPCGDRCGATGAYPGQQSSESTMPQSSPSYCMAPKPGH